MQHSFTVFVVDDEEPIRRAFDMFFSARGILVRSFPDGSDFLHAYDPDWTGCLFIDIRTPYMSGPELYRRLRRQQITLPVVFMTGHEDVESLQSEFGAAMLVLKKPFSAVQLDAIVKRWSSGHHLES